jgi:hypothetical protein
VDGNGVGETMTYRFPSPVHLVPIALVNGYAKTPRLRADNGRIRGVVILADQGTLGATLSDTPSRQRLDQDIGVTRKLTLRVTSIYPAPGTATWPLARSRSGPFRARAEQMARPTGRGHLRQLVVSWRAPCRRGDAVAFAVAAFEQRDYRHENSSPSPGSHPAPPSQASASHPT